MRRKFIYCIGRSEIALLNPKPQPGDPGAYLGTASKQRHTRFPILWISDSFSGHLVE